MVDVPSTMAVIKGAYEALKSIAQIKGWVASAEAELKIAIAQKALSEAENTIGKLEHENDQLKAENKKIRHQQSEIKSLKRFKELFVEESTNLFKCTHCIEKDGIALTLANQTDRSPRMKCNGCGSEFRNPNYIAQLIEPFPMEDPLKHFRG